MNSSIDTVHRYILGQIDIVEEWEPLAREGTDPEGVHKMRVAIRRTRTIVWTFREALPDDAGKHFVAELRWIARQLGQARDSDICAESFEQYEARLQQEATKEIEPFASFIRATRVEAYESVRAALSDERYTVLMEGLRDLTVNNPADAIEGSHGTRPIAADDCLSIATAKVAEHGNRITTNSTAAELHKLRIKVKQLRYMLDFLAAHETSHIGRLAGITRELQELLGKHQDAITVQKALAAYEESSQARRVPVQESGLMKPFNQQLEAHMDECRGKFPEIWARWKFY